MTAATMGKSTASSRKVVGSTASLFCAHAAEDSCLSVPLVMNEGECLDLSPLRPSEFTNKIRGIADEIRRSYARSLGGQH